MKTFTLLALLGMLLPLSSATSIKRAPRQATKRQTPNPSPDYSGVNLLAPNGSPFNYITTQINIPFTRYVSGESSPPALQTALIWVGFGAHSDTLAQTGCTVFNDGQQDRYSRCWYEWFPNPLQYYSGFEPAVGDTVQLELWRNSNTQATSKITDLTTGAVYSTTFSAPGGYSVSGQNAKWIVEAHEGNFVDFQAEFFEGCAATTEDGNSYGPGDGTYYLDYRVSSGVQYTGVSLPSDSEVQVNWVYSGAVSSAASS